MSYNQPPTFYPPGSPNQTPSIRGNSSMKLAKYKEPWVVGGKVLGESTYPVNITLPETNSLHLKVDGWKINFLLGNPIFRGYGYVSFREGILAY